LLDLAETTHLERHTYFVILSLLLAAKSESRPLRFCLLWATNH